MMASSNSLSKIFRIARLTVLEGVRGRFFWLVALMLLLGVALALFAHTLALTESQAVRSLLLGSFLRLASVVLLGLTVVTAMVREMDDKISELFLSLALPRYAYYCGRLAGFSLLAIFTAALCYAPLALAGDAWLALPWALSLACELMVVSAAALLFVFTFSQATPALIALMAFYLLARSLAAFQLMAGGVFHQADVLSNHALRLALEGLALVMPGLHHFTLADWLVYGEAWARLPAIALETLVYFLLLSTAGLVDLHRKNY